MRSVIWVTCFQFLSTMTLLMPLLRINAQIGTGLVEYNVQAAVDTKHHLVVEHSFAELPDSPHFTRNRAGVKEPPQRTQAFPGKC